LELSDKLSRHGVVLLAAFNQLVKNVQSFAQGLKIGATDLGVPKKGHFIVTKLSQLKLVGARLSRLNLDKSIYLKNICDGGGARATCDASARGDTSVTTAKTAETAKAAKAA
jgi:hypothetical protein